MSGDTITGVVVVVGALVTAVVKIIAALRETKAVVVERAASQDVELREIKVLVDGRYGEVLQELADMKKLLASETGRKADAQQAASAQKRADDQVARVAEAGKKGSEPPK